MKRLLTIVSLLVGVGSTHAQTLVLSDFSSFTADYFSTADAGPWSEATSQSGPTRFTIADFGAGTPSGRSGNGFIQWLGDVPQDWSAFTNVMLTGLTPLANQTTTLRFYFEDLAGNSSALTSFNLADFASGPSTFSLPLLFGAVNPAEVDYWGFVVSDFGSAPEFAFTFDQVALVAIPEPATTAAALGAFALSAAALFRRRRKQEPVVAFDGVELPE